MKTRLRSGSTESSKDLESMFFCEGTAHLFDGLSPMVSFNFNFNNSFVIRISDEDRKEKMDFENECLNEGIGNINIYIYKERKMNR